MLLRWQILRTTRRVCARSLSQTTEFRKHNIPRQRRKDFVPTTDTIYALSTAPGRAAIAIVRISGPACLDIYGGLCPQRAFPNPRSATLRKLYDPTQTDRELDPGALVLYFPAPKTVTGEDVLELHIHGGPAIVKSVLEAIPKCVDSRPRRRTADYSLIRAAEPGEFTKRAFYNGMIDLTQAEALGESLAAETEQQRRLAVAGSNDSLTTRYEGWRQLLLHARGELEALIDFSEDQHFDESPASFLDSISTQVKDLERQIGLHIVNASRGELLRSGINVALLGAPNAGKSSLLNRIVGREAAIVSSEPGTTRDIVDVSVDIGGWLVKLGDMAGLRTPKQIGQVEQEGIRRARERASQADMVLTLIALKRSTDGEVAPDIDSHVSEMVHECQASGKTTILYVINKLDLAADHQQPREVMYDKLISALPGAAASPVFFVSCKEAALGIGPDPGGIQRFLRGLIAAFAAMTSAATGHQESQAYWETSLSITHRQSEYLRQCLSHLRDFLRMHDSRARGADLVGEVVNEIDTHHTNHGTGLRPKCNIWSAAPAPGDHPPASAYHGTGQQDHFDIVQAAEHLRYAAACLAKITGRGSETDVEEVLGVVFEK